MGSGHIVTCKCKGRVRMGFQCMLGGKTGEVANICRGVNFFTLSGWHAIGRMNGTQVGLESWGRKE